MSGHNIRDLIPASTVLGGITVLSKKDILDVCDNTHNVQIIASENERCKYDLEVLNVKLLRAL